MIDPRSLPLHRAPFYVWDMERLRARYRDFHAAFSACFDDVVVGYSYKTCHLPYLCKALHALGARAEVVSELEYDLALRLQVPAPRIIVNGPGKSAAFLRRALGAGASVNLDSLDEVAHLTGAQAPGPGTVGLRVAVRHPESAEGRWSRFGIARDNGDLARARDALARHGVPVGGLHVHLSTRARDEDTFRGLARALLAAAREVGEDGLRTIDVGGGFGYAPPAFRVRDYPAFADYARALREELDPLFARAERTLVAEPGIAMVNDCASMLAPVLAVKRLPDRNVVVVDASVHTVKPTRHRFALPSTLLEADGAIKEGRTTPWDVVGYTCMEDDVIAPGLPLPAPAVGDVLRIDHVGAYTFVFKPPFIRAMPAMYAVEGDRLVQVRRAETLDGVVGDYAL